MLAYFIGILLCMLCFLCVLCFFECKAYIIHISLFVSAFIPIWNFLAVIAFAIVVSVKAPFGEIKFKVNKATKFLFDIDE